MLKKPFRYFLLVALLLVVGLLVACGENPNPTSNTGNSGNVSNTPTPSPTPTLTPTSTPTPIPTPSQTYNANTFSILYPSSWTVTSTSSAITNFEDETHAKFSVSVKQLDVQMKLRVLIAGMSGSQVTNFPATRTVNGIIWEQQKWQGTSTLVALVSQQPVGSAGIVLIVYQSITEKFDTYNDRVFEPMLQSFKVK